MAATKLSALTALLGTEVAADDLMYVADVSANLGKKIDLSQFGGKYLLDEITNSVAGVFDFTDIPQQFNRLHIMGTIRGNQVLTNIAPYCFFNNDTTLANYMYNQIVGDNGSAAGNESVNPLVSGIDAASSVANSYSILHLQFEGYANSWLKSMRSTSTIYITGGSTARIYGSITWHDTMTAALTRLTIQATNTPTNDLLGTLRLYGEY